MAEKNGDRKRQESRDEQVEGRTTIWPGIWALSMQPVIDRFRSDELRKNAPRPSSQLRRRR